MLSNDYIFCVLLGLAEVVVTTVLWVLLPSYQLFFTTFQSHRFKKNSIAGEPVTSLRMVSKSHIAATLTH